ncbi:MAG: sugar transferase [Chloroflexi bacterium]|nr:sugar transferase [Chloroflexota bacterium]
MLNSSSFAFRKHILARHRWLDRINAKKSALDLRSYMLAKRVMDITLVVLALPLVLPLMLLCIILIKLEDPRAPIFFIQSRTGKGGNRFGMYKFRTMLPNAEELKKQLAPTNAEGELAGPLKLAHDPRITRVGRILRKTSLDELPQLINVLKGEMSMVGPRPTSFGLKSYMLWHTERLDVTPGITGLWQLYGRGDINFDTWLYWDSLYIEKRSIGLDLQIIMRTIFAVFGQRGAR